MKKNIKTIWTPLLIAAIVLLAAPCGRKGPDAPLTIVSTSPAKNEGGIPRNAVVSVTFSEPVDANTVHFTLMVGANAVPVTMSYQEATSFFAPAGLLADNTVYTAIVSGGVRDLYGDTMDQDYLWYFVTGATTTAQPATYTVTASASSGGSISPTGAVTVNNGAVQPFTVTASWGYHIATVTGCGGTLSGTTYVTGAIQADCAVTATFVADTPAPATHTVTAAADSYGAISPTGAVTVNDGASLNFTIACNTGYHISDVLVDGISIGAATNYTFANVTADHWISASCAADAPAMYTITVGPVENGSITPGTTTVQNGADQSFTIEAHFGYYISEVKADDQKIDDLSRYEQKYTYTFTNVTSDHKITARFRGLWHISATFGENGSISPAGDVQVEDGADQAFTISTDASYAISELIVDGAPVQTAATYTFINVTADHSIHANFAGSIWPVTTAGRADGCLAGDTPSSAAYEHTVTYTVIPDAQYSITSATGCGGTLAGHISTTGFVTADCSVTSLFSNILLTITPLTEANGSISRDTPQLVGYNTTATFTIMPGPVAADCAATASFAASLLTVTALADANGEIALSAPQQVNCQGSAVFVITPAPGYDIGSVEGCGGTLSGNLYTTSPITGDCTVTATFNQSISI